MGPPGERILILGDYLGETTEVTINGIPAQFEVTGSIDPRKHMVHVRVPEDATTGLITLTTPHGSFTAAEPFVVEDGRPVIESFSPTSGPPGTSIVVFGQNLVYATSLSLNGLEMDQWYSMGNPSRTLVGRIPAKASTGPLSVTTPHGTFTSVAVLTVTAPPPLAVLNWPTATEAGNSLWLRVTDNYLVRDVQLSGTSIPFHLIPTEDIAVYLPTNAVSGPLTIVTDNETVTSPQPLIIHPKPLLTGVRPTFGAAGTVVQLVGRDLQNVTEVRLRNMTVPFDKETLTFTVPADAKTGFVAIYTPFSSQYTELQFAITSGRISTSSGTIRGAVPQFDPIPVTGIIPALRERVTSSAGPLLPGQE